MKLKPDIDAAAFIKTVQGCANDVLFTSQDGDRLNLKSTLSQFLFAMLQAKPKLLQGGSILYDKADEEILLPYLRA